MFSNKKYFILIIFLILITFLIFFQNILFKKNIKFNFIKHATDLSYYAHFSKINKFNYFIYPKLLFTNPIHLELKSGDSLYIPKNTWHWIRTENKSLSINFWYEKSKCNENINKHMILKNQINKWILNEHNYLNILKNEKVRIWDSEKNSSSHDFNTTFNKFINSNSKNKYLITLPDFYVGNYNQKLKNVLKKYYNIPPFVKEYSNSNVDSNIWISSSSHDTGLHYDNFYGLLCVIKGKKKVTLFPKEDTKYLYPYDTTPTFIKKAVPSLFRYNKYEMIKPLKNSFSSQYFFYKLFKKLDVFYHCKKMAFEIHDIVERPVVWGLKWDNTNIRFEYYNYKWGIKGSSDKNILSMIPKKFNNIINNISNIVTVSIDSYNQDKEFILDKVNTIHVYTIKNLNYPVFGETTEYNYINKKIKSKNESSYFYSDYSDTIKNYKEYLLKIGYSLKDINKLDTNIFKKYQCLEICIHKKLYKNKIVFFIQYIGISIDDFIDFLIEANYSINIINFVKNNRKNLKQLSHEITIVYDLDTMKILRSGFYGII